MASISSPMTELKLRTNFILDRAAFLESVCEAVHKEDTRQAYDMLDLLLNNDYPSIIASILSAKATANDRDQAVWALANLLGSDRQDVRAAANRACLSARAQIFNNLLAPETPVLQKSIAYLLFNWLTRFGKNEEVDEQVLRLLDTGFIRNVKPVAVRIDLVAAAKAALRRTQAGAKAAREVVKMLEAATNKRELDLLLKAFSEICSEDGEKSSFAPADHAAVFDLFEHLLLGEVELTQQQYVELLWSLSNFVCEPEAADKFFTRADLRAEVVALCEAEDDAVRAEAGWVLANAIKKSTWESTQEDIGTDYGLRYTLYWEAVLHEKSSKLYTAIHESLDRLSELEALFAPLEEDEDEDALTEIAEEEEIVPGLTAAQICEMAGVYNGHFNLPCDRPDPSPAVAATEAPLPSALELVAGPVTHNGSATLRGLVFSLKNAAAAGNAWVPVAAGTTFTIEDLTLMGSLGYVLANGYFGINPCLRSF